MNFPVQLRVRRQHFGNLQTQCKDGRLSKIIIAVNYIDICQTSARRFGGLSKIIIAVNYIDVCQTSARRFGGLGKIIIAVNYKMTTSSRPDMNSTSTIFRNFTRSGSTNVSVSSPLASTERLSPSEARS